MWNVQAQTYWKQREGSCTALKFLGFFLECETKVKNLSVLLEGNWTWVLLHPRSIEIRNSFCLWHFSLLYRWLSCHWACTNQERRWPWDLMNNIKVHLLIWAELDLNDDIYIMADDNMNCGILTLEIFFSYVYRKTKRLCWMALYKETIWNVLLRVAFWFLFLYFPYTFFFFSSPPLDMTPAFSSLYQNRNGFGAMMLNP